MKITATIIALNEEANIGSCLASLDFADEIVVVDSGSTDRTEEICRAHPRVRFVRHSWEGYGRQKNVAATLASHDWIFNIDADERVSPRLKESILSATLGDVPCYKVARENYFGERWIRRCGWYPDYNMRLYDRRRSSFSERSVHESLVTEGPVEILSGNLVHMTYSGISDYLLRMDKYSTLAANELVKAGKKPGVLHLVGKPLFTFLKMYLLKLGFLEGYTGFLLSMLYSHYTFYKYGKAIELNKSEKVCG
ncbi:glycosyltransferase family 2 protein [Geomonas sp. RF6]|uniref:glycosyltransferase family 2 protein n=1 Tax=Geomonas sp. RF6 TaxID=2897342 RepID=UPI001E2BC70E|nr:glycosyltransferase family 2 protein [Geomonas sp. RF6]UFS68640.1 glycosyltransferase family 2 protein [Geomonas sp. RF6]